MGGVGIFILIWAVIAIIRAIMSSSSNSSGVSEEFRKSHEAGLQVQCTRDMFVPEEALEQLPIIRVSISGAVVLPHDNFNSMIRVWLLDVTECQAEPLGFLGSNKSETDPFPVFCMIPDEEGNKGVYRNDREAQIPYQMSEIRELEVAVVPSFALLLPKKGDRCLKVCVAITPAADEDKIYAFGSVLLAHKQETTGYTEFKQHTLDQERQVVKLAYALSAADGRIDPRETETIRRFFAVRLADEADEAERKQRVEQTLTETLATLKSGQEKPVSLIKRLCQEIADDDDPSLAQAAYELCAQVVAVDDDIGETEQQGLKYIAKQLKLPDEYVREVHDRFMRLSMYDKAGEQALLDMPKGLTHEEKIEFLNQEYRKWRSRAAHKDPAVATEANLRLQQITRARRELQEA